jgi:hypothetical protein
MKRYGTKQTASTPISNNAPDGCEGVFSHRGRIISEEIAVCTIRKTLNVSRSVTLRPTVGTLELVNMEHFLRGPVVSFCNLYLHQ